MANLTIKNIGPVSTVNISLNKVNIIIGPQSSGKSTICKIACYCSWVEKRICINQSFDDFLEDNFFERELVRFHKMEGYLSDESSFEYESDVLKLSYSHKVGKPSFEWKDRYGFKRSKIAYIPSERNLVSAIDNWMEVKFRNNNIRNFMVDWYEARDTYTSSNPLSILDLGVEYYYDENNFGDVVRLKKQEKLIKLTNTSSGLQSIIPLQSVAEYLSSHIYKAEIPVSISELSKNQTLASKIFEDKYQASEITLPQSGESQSIYISAEKDIKWELREVKDSDKFTIQKPNKDDSLKIFQSEEAEQEYQKTIRNFTKIQYTKLFIEEPEQNIFPATQRDLIYYFLELVQRNDLHTLFLTTHSPYIINALNNCLIGYLVQDEIADDEKEDLKSNASWINPQSVSVYEVTDSGSLQNIQTERGTISKHYFNRVMNEILDEYYDMLEFLKPESNEE